MLTTLGMRCMEAVKIFLNWKNDTDCMQNLHISEEPREFFVWVNPNNFIANWNLNKMGTFTSTSNTTDGDMLMFRPNPGFNNIISPFQANLLWSYLAEYNLELSRRHYFKEYPSRLSAIFLFDREDEARKYHSRQQLHVGDRELKRVVSVGKYLFSKHDCSWIDFMRLPNSKLGDTTHAVCNAYWGGETVEGNTLYHGDEPWSESPISEVLFIGRVDLVRDA
jgi:hypothetical protein